MTRLPECVNIGDNYRMEFGKRLAEARKRLGLNQERVAKRLGLSRSSVGMIETDRAPLEVKRLVALGAEGLDVLYVLTGEPSRVAAGRMLDWPLCLALLQRIDAWEKQRGARISPDHLHIVLKHMYLDAARRGLVGDTLDEILEAAAA